MVNQWLINSLPTRSRTQFGDPSGMSTCWDATGSSALRGGLEKAEEMGSSRQK